jgi:hypothetical protein
MNPNANPLGKLYYHDGLKSYINRGFRSVDSRYIMAVIMYQKDKN